MRTGLALGLALAAALTAPARADCGQDMQKLALARNGEMQKINDFFKAFKGKPADPAAACAKTSGLLRADEAINNLKAGHVKNVAFSERACKVAAQFKKMKEQAAKSEAAGGGGGPQAQPLPAGPL